MRDYPERTLRAINRAYNHVLTHQTEAERIEDSCFDDIEAEEQFHELFTAIDAMEPITRRIQ